MIVDPQPPTEMTLSRAINFYEETINDPSIAIPTILKQASYKDLYVYFAYALPFDTTWGETQAGNDYLMRKIRGLNADEILQYEAERNARFLWNSVHPRNVMEELSPYIEEIEIQKPMPDDPPVPTPPSTSWCLRLCQRTCTTRNILLWVRTIRRRRQSCWGWRTTRTTAATSRPKIRAPTISCAAPNTRPTSTLATG